MAQAYALALHRAGDEKAAIDMVRTVARSLTKRADLNRLYLLAADLYEDRGLLDLAVEALRGRL